MMNYDSLYSYFITFVPQYRTWLERKCMECHAEESDGMHIMFGMVVVPFVIELLHACDTETLKKVFAFFEDMALTSDKEIQEVLEFTVLEGLISAGEGILLQCKTYMGPETMESCISVEQYIG